MSILNVNEISPDSVNPRVSPNPFTPISQEADATSISVVTSHRAGQRRLRTESFPQRNIHNVMASPIAAHPFDPRIDKEMVQKISRYFNNEKKWNPLNYAIEQNDYECALVIFDYLENISTIDDEFNPLNRILRNECKKMDLSIAPELRKNLDENATKLISKILDSGIDIHKTSSQNKVFSSPIKFCVCSDTASCSSIVYACYLGLEDLVVDFLNRDEDINQDSGRPLVAAIEAGHLNIVHLLIGRGVKINVLALMSAVRARNSEAIYIIDILLKAGGDIGHINGSLMSVISSGWDSPYIRNPLDALLLLEFLLSRGANPKIIFGGKALLAGVLSKSADTEEKQTYKTEVVRLLLEYGATL